MLSSLELRRHALMHQHENYVGAREFLSNSGVHTFEWHELFVK